MRNRINEDTRDVLIDIAFVVYHEFEGEIPLALLPFKDELEVLLNNINFTIH